MRSNSLYFSPLNILIIDIKFMILNNGGNLMKIKVNLDANERKLIMNFLVHLNEDKIKGVIENYNDYKYDGDNTFNNLNISEVFEGAKELLGHILSEKEVFYTEVDNILAFYFWLGAQSDNDTSYILEKPYDEEVSNTDHAMLNLYCDLDRALEAYSFGDINY